METTEHLLSTQVETSLEIDLNIESLKSLQLKALTVEITGTKVEFGLESHWKPTGKEVEIP